MSDFFVSSPDFHGILAVVVGLALAGIPIVSIIAYRLGRRIERRSMITRIHRHIDLK